MRLSGILGPGHVTTVIGTDAWNFLPQPVWCSNRRGRLSSLSISFGGSACSWIRSAEGQTRVDNAYSRSVLPQGNRTALTIMNRVFEVCDAEWRGLGILPRSGLALREAYARFDASKAFQIQCHLQ